MMFCGEWLANTDLKPAVCIPVTAALVPLCTAERQRRMKSLVSLSKENDSDTGTNNTAT